MLLKEPVNQIGRKSREHSDRCAIRPKLVGSQSGDQRQPHRAMQDQEALVGTLLLKIVPVDCTSKFATKSVGSSFISP